MTETPNPQGDPHAGAEQPPQQPAYQQAPYGQPPQPYGYYPPPAVRTSNDRMWASAAHWGTIVAAWLAMGFLAPLVIMLTVGNDSPYVRKQAVESLNFQISLLIYAAAGVLFSIVTLGLGLLLVLPVAGIVAIVALVLIVIASVRAGNGEDFTYPLTLHLVH
jgi:uncharacterized Tic20 family protein